MSNANRKTPQERFFKNVQKTEACWLWTAGRVDKKSPYGRFSVDGHRVLAHRFSYELENGPVPKELTIDHICHNKACVNPEHLRTVTQKQNAENRTGILRSNTSGVTGVHWAKKRAIWRVVVFHYGKAHYGGNFKDLDQAAEAARQLRLRLFTHNDLDRVDS